VVVSMTLLTVAADCHTAVAPSLLGAWRLLQQSVDTACLQGAQQQTHHTLLQWSTDGTDKHHAIT